MRLTKSIKQEIRQNFAAQYIKTNKLDELNKKLQKATTELYLLVWQTDVGVDYHKFHTEVSAAVKTLNKMASPLPKAAFINSSKSSTVSLSVLQLDNIFDDETATLITSLPDIVQSPGETIYHHYRRLPLDDSYYDTRNYGDTLNNVLSKASIKQSPEYIALYDLLFIVQETVKAYQKTMSQIDSILSSVTTSKKLHELWPESVELTPPEPTKPGLPSIPVSDLNSKFGLPTNKT